MLSVVLQSLQADRPQVVPPMLEWSSQLFILCYRSESRTNDSLSIGCFSTVHVLCVLCAFCSLSCFPPASLGKATCTAITFIGPDEEQYAPGLIEALEDCGAGVPDCLRVSWRSQPASARLCQQGTPALAVPAATTLSEDFHQHKQCCRVCRTRQF